MCIITRSLLCHKGFIILIKEQSVWNRRSLEKSNTALSPAPSPHHGTEVGPWWPSLWFSRVRENHTILPPDPAEPGSLPELFTMQRKGVRTRTAGLSSGTEDRHASATELTRDHLSPVLPKPFTLKTTPVHFQ